MTIWCGDGSDGDGNDGDDRDSDILWMVCP